jgi:hypothetical protein
MGSAADAAAAADAFTAVLLPRRRREAVADVEADLAVMTAAYGRDHVLSARLGRVVAGVVGRERGQGA